MSSYNDFRSQQGAASTSTGHPSAVPESQNSEARMNINIRQLLSQPGREVLPILHPRRPPGTHWFRHSKAIKRTIYNMLRTQLANPYPTYRKMPSDEKESWFTSFAQSYNWHESHTEMVRAEFDSQCKDHFKNHMHKWKKCWKRGEGKPPDLNEDVWLGFIRYWSSASVTKVSDTNSKNRLSRRGGYGVAVHNNGSQTFDARAAQLAEEAGGVPPDHLTLMRVTHTNKKTGQIQDKRISEIIENVEMKKSELLTQLSEGESVAGSCSIDLPPHEINRLVLEEMPKTKKGRPYGLGRVLDSQYYAGSSSSYVDQVPEMVERLVNERLAQKDVEMQLVKEKLAQKDAEMAQLKSSLEYLSGIVSQHFPPPPAN